MCIESVLVNLKTWLLYLPCTVSVAYGIHNLYFSFYRTPIRSKKAGQLNL